MGLLYNCPCSDTTINIPLPQALMISENEIERLCLYEKGCHISNPWHESNLEEGKIQLKSYKKTSLDDMDYEDDEEEEDDGTPELRWDTEFEE
jgi:hypothetical protein